MVAQMIGVFANAMMVATCQNPRQLNRPAPRKRAEGKPWNLEKRDD